MDFDQISKGLQTSGLQLDGFELEAHALWNKLENLASNDPVQYQQFIDQAVALKKGDKNEENKSFRPEPGFCIKTISLGGYKKRKIILGRENNFGLNIYVNFCHHPAVDPARNGNSIANLTDFQSSANIEIPLAVGFVREITVESAKKEDLVIDVVFHSDVLSASQYEPFKTSLIQLALRAISEDEGIKLDLSHIVHLPKSKRYVGGLDANEGTPVRFIVQTNLNSTKTQELSLATITKEINNQLEGNQCLCASSVALITSSSIKKSRPKITVLPDIKIKSYFEIDSKLGDHLTLKVKVLIFSYKLGCILLLLHFKCHARNMMDLLH